MNTDEVRKRDEIEAALRESERRWRSVVTGAPIVLFALDRDGVFTLSEGKGLEALGLKPGQVVGRSVFEVYENYEEICNHARRALAGASIHEEVEVGDLTFDTSYSPCFDDDGTPAGVIGVATDVTERRRLERRIEEARRVESLGILAGGIAHDFNNLLTAILGNTGLALSRLARDDSVWPLLARVETAARRAGDLTSQMLAYSGKGRFVVETVDVGAFLLELREGLEELAGNGIDLRLEPASGTPTVDADRGRLRELVHSLVTNACEACTRRGGRVRVRTAEREVGAAELSGCFLGDECRPGRFVSIRVEDDGEGMDPPTASRVFDPFFTTKTPGRGLGLAAVLGIIRGHGGAVRLESSPGTGTVVEALFPPANVGPPEQEVNPVEQSSSGNQSPRALVVDDREVIREVAGLALENIGFEILEAESGEQALEVYAGHKGEVTLVLLDLSMDGMSGHEAYVALRKQQADLPVVLMSGLPDDETLRRSLDDGAYCAFLQKPFTPAELQATVRKVLAIGA